MASAQTGCYVQPSQTGGTCHYKADGGMGGYTVWTQGAWKITQKFHRKTRVLASSTKNSPSSGQFAKNPPKGAVVTLTISSSGGGAVGGN